MKIRAAKRLLTAGRYVGTQEWFLGLPDEKQRDYLAKKPCSTFKPVHKEVKENKSKATKSAQTKLRNRAEQHLDNRTGLSATAAKWPPRYPVVDRTGKEYPNSKNKWVTPKVTGTSNGEVLYFDHTGHAVGEVQFVRIYTATMSWYSLRAVVKCERSWQIDKEFGPPGKDYTDADLKTAKKWVVDKIKELDTAKATRDAKKKPNPEKSSTAIGRLRELASHPMLQELRSEYDGKEFGPIIFQVYEHNGVVTVSWELTFRRSTRVGAFRKYQSQINHANGILDKIANDLENSTKFSVVSISKATLKSAESSDQMAEDNEGSAYSEYEQSLGGEIKIK